MQNTTHETILIDLGRVKQLTGFKSPTTLYTLQREREFPQAIRIGRTKRWLLHEVQGWIDHQVKASRGSL